MSKIKIAIMTLVITIPLAVAGFWPAKNNATVKNPPIVTSKQPLLPETPKFNPKEIVNQYPFKGNPPDLTIIPKSHPSTSPELEGQINNEYQVREDILKAIEGLAVNNEKARRAAIKYAYYDNQIYYHSLTSEEARVWDAKSKLVCRCLVLAAPDNWLMIHRKYREMMVDSEKRYEHQRQLDRDFFGGKMLSSGLTVAEENERCKSGAY